MPIQISQNATQEGSFVPTSNVWDVTDIFNLQQESEELKELLVRLYQNLNVMATVLNFKDSGFYDTTEFINGQLYFPNPANTSSTPIEPNFRQVYRKVVNYGPLPPPGSYVGVPHGITCNTFTTFTRFYGVANRTGAPGLSYLPLPYASGATATSIEMNADGEMVYIKTNTAVLFGGPPALYSIVYVVLEYIQS
jgi:hypothetical protein